MPKDAVTRRRDRRPAGFCQEQTPVLIEQFSSMEHDRFHVPYLSDKIPETVFHGQAVKTVAYLRVSTAQQDVRSQRGDRLVVSELSRLGRSLGQIVAILDALARAGVAFVAMKENIRVRANANR